MTQTRRMSRRRWLSLVAGSGVLFTSPARPRPPGAWWEPQHVAAARLSRVLVHRESARAIGLAYLCERPDEAAAPLLLRHVVSALHTVDGRRPAGDADLRQHLARRIQRDFADRNVVMVRGWILSTTEARLCALSTLA